jgi:hypothetical protein
MPLFQRCSSAAQIRCNALSPFPSITAPASCGCCCCCLPQRSNLLALVHVAKQAHGTQLRCIMLQNSSSSQATCCCSSTIAPTACASATGEARAQSATALYCHCSTAVAAKLLAAVLLALPRLLAHVARQLHWAQLRCTPVAAQQ